LAVDPRPDPPVARSHRELAVVGLDKLENDPRGLLHGVQLTLAGPSCDLSRLEAAGNAHPHGIPERISWRPLSG
jgi:hypothetical protein